MSVEISKLKIVIETDHTRLKSGLNESRQAVQGFSTGAIGALGGFAGFVAGAAADAVVSFTKKGIEGFKDLEQEVANISSIKPTIDTKQVFDSLNAMQTRVPQSAKQLGEALYDVFSSVNVSQKEGLKLVEQFARGGTAAQTSAKTFGTAVTGVLNAYSLNVKEATKISDLFFNTVNLGVINGKQLANGLGPVAKSARNLGQDLNVAFGAMAAVTKAGGSASQSMNDLNNLFEKLQTDKAKDGFKLLGMSVTDASGKFRQINDIVGEYKEKVKNLSQEQQGAFLQKIFPDMQARRGFSTLISQFEAMNEAIKVNKEQSGSAAAAYEKMSQTFKAQSQLMTQGLQAIGIEIASQVLPMLTPLVTALARDLPGALEKTREGFAAMKRDAMPAMDAIKSGFLAVWPQIKSAAITALTPLWEYIKGNAQIVISWWQENYRPLIQQTIATVTRTMREFWDKHGKEIMGVIGPLYAAVGGIIRMGLQVALGFIKYAMQVMNGDWKGAWETAKATARVAFEGITGIIRNGVTVVNSALSLMVTSVADIAVRYGKAALSLGTAIIEGIVRGIKSGWKWVQDTVSGLASAAVTAAKDFLGIRSPSRVFAQIGNQVAEGLVMGMQAKSMTVSEAGRILAGEAHKGAKKGLKEAKTELQKETEAFATALASAKAKYKELQAGGSEDDQNVASRFRLLSEARRHELSGIYESIKGIEAEKAAIEKRREAQQRLRDDLEQTRSEIQKQIALKEALDSRDKLSLQYFDKIFAQLSDPQNRAMIQKLAELRGPLISSGTSSAGALTASIPALPGVSGGRASNRRAPGGLVSLSELVQTMPVDDSDRTAEKAFRQAQALKAVSLEFRRGFHQAFVQTLTDGGNMFDNLTKMFKQMVTRMVAEWAASQIFGSLSGGLIGGGGLGGGLIGAALGGLFRGFRASGGPVSAGGAYIVGERGPELFTPSQSGRIIPNGAGGGAVINLALHGDINNLGGLDRLSAEITKAVEIGLRVQR